jgi:hypothetical protein
MKLLINDAIKKYVHDKGTPTIGDDDDDDDDDDADLSSPLPKRRIPADDDDDDDGDDGGGGDGDAAVEEDEVGDLPNVQIDNEYEEDYQLSQKMIKINRDYHYCQY